MSKSEKTTPADQQPDAAKLAEENKALREALAAATADDSKAKLEAAEKKAADAEARLATTTREASFTSTFAAKGIIDPKKATAIKLLVGDAADVPAAVEKVLSEHEYLKPGPTKDPAKPARRPGPANPPAQSKASPSGYMSPETYMAMTAEERMEAHRDGRVAKAKKYWPRMLPASTFGTGE